MIRSHFVIVLVLSAFMGTHALAAAVKPPEAGETNADLRLDLSGVGLPVLKDGRVMNFVFVRARIYLNPGLARAEVDAREPFIREALLRSAYRSPLNPPNDFMSLDPKVFEAVLLRDARSVLGAKIVSSVRLRSQKGRSWSLPLRPRRGAQGRPFSRETSSFSVSSRNRAAVSGGGCNSHCMRG